MNCTLLDILTALLKISGGNGAEPFAAPVDLEVVELRYKLPKQSISEGIESNYSLHQSGEVKRIVN